MTTAPYPLKYHGEVIFMPWSYSKLWKLLIDKKLKKRDLIRKVGINTNALNHLNKDEDVAMSALDKICEELDCDIGDIVEHVKKNRTAEKETD